MKIMRIKKFTVIGLVLCAMLMVRGSEGAEATGGADQGIRQPALNDSRVPRGMVLITGGTNAGTSPRAPGELYHNVSYPATYNITVEDFLMDKTLVTKRLWDWVRDDPATVFRGYEMSAGGGRGPDHPVHTVSWFDAIKWLNARSDLEGREPAYYLDAAYTQIFRSGSGGERDAYWEVHIKTSADGYRLPTMDQWEYAARGGLQSKRFPWGDRIDHSKANYIAHGEGFEYDDGPEGRVHHPKGSEGLPMTTPVDFFEPNNYGLHDMVGNLWEWCCDWFLERGGLLPVIRGGSWTGYARNCRVAGRVSTRPDTACHFIGFRSVLPSGPADTP